MSYLKSKYRIRRLKPFKINIHDENFDKPLSELEKHFEDIEKLILSAGFNVGLDYWLCKEDCYNFLYFDDETDFKQFKELLKQ